MISFQALMSLFLYLFCRRGKRFGEIKLAQVRKWLNAMGFLSSPAHMGWNVLPPSFCWAEPGREFISFVMIITSSLMVVSESSNAFPLKGSFYVDEPLLASTCKPECQKQETKFSILCFLQFDEGLWHENLFFCSCKATEVLPWDWQCFSWVSCGRDSPVSCVSSYLLADPTSYWVLISFQEGDQSWAAHLFSLACSSVFWKGDFELIFLLVCRQQWWDNSSVYL